MMKRSPKTLASEIIEYVIKPTIPEDLMDDDTRILVNPTGGSRRADPLPTPALPEGS